MAINHEATGLNKGLRMLDASPFILKYYGPYTSITEAIQALLEAQSYFGILHAGYKVGIGTFTTVAGKRVCSSISLEYIYIGGEINEQHLVPLILDKAKLDGIAAGAEVNIVKSVDTTASNGVNLSLDDSSKLDVVISTGSIASGNTSLVTGGTVYSTTNSLAPKASPTFTGTPKAPTAAAGTNTTQIATTAFVADAVSTAVGDTVDEVSLDQNYTNKVNVDYTLTKGGGGTLEIAAATDTKAGVMTKDDRLLLNLLIPVVESGGWNIDENYQVGGTTEGGSPLPTIPEGLETRLARIEAILGDLYDGDDDSGASDGHIEIS